MTAQSNSLASKHPKELLQFFVLGLCLLWQTPVFFLSVLIFLICIRGIKIHCVWMVSFGITIFLLAMVAEHFEKETNFTFQTILSHGFSLNLIFWKMLFHAGISSTFQFLSHQEFNYLLGLPILIAGILGVIDLIPRSPHERAMKNLHLGKHDNHSELKIDKLNSLLSKLKDEDFDGTLLGISKKTGKSVVVPDHYVNQHALVLGTTGGGKTITLRRFYQRAAMCGYPLIIVDGKPSEDNVTWLSNLSHKYNRPFYGFNCGNYNTYDPLAQGGYTELKDKIISLKDVWENDYYKSVAEDCLQTTFEVLLKSKERYDLKKVVECLDYENLTLMVRKINDERLIHRVRRLENYDRKDITGLQAHLSLLIHSELGGYFEQNEKTFNLVDVINNNGMVYFALPALRFPGFSKVLGKLVINDIKATIDRLSERNTIFTVFDEFSVFAGDQVLNLVNMGRGKGVHAVFGTQGLADLSSVSPVFVNQVLNCVNTLICHRLNDAESAEQVASWIGTQDTFDVTAQLDMERNKKNMGSVKKNKSFIVHPDEIKQSLNAGEAFFINKADHFVSDKIKVKYT